MSRNLSKELYQAVHKIHALILIDREKLITAGSDGSLQTGESKDTPEGP
jgi:hypothetical protein